jgi:hypothetical protein
MRGLPARLVAQLLMVYCAGMPQPAAESGPMGEDRWVVLKLATEMLSLLAAMPLGESIGDAEGAPITADNRTSPPPSLFMIWALPPMGRVPLPILTVTSKMMTMRLYFYFYFQNEYIEAVVRQPIM